MEAEKLLHDLSLTPGVAGHESRVCEVIRALWEPLVDEIQVDPLGSLIATKRGSGPEPRRRLMLASHMDEIGLMITRLEGEFLRFTAVGGIDKRVLLGQKVVVHGREDITGLIGSRPPHVLPADERDKYPDYPGFVIDTGLTEKQLAERVKVGDVVSFAVEPVKLEADLVTGKAFDNRASVAAVTLMLEALKGREHAWDVVAVATVQEEVGLKGAKTSAWGVNPDLAIAIDVTFGQGNGVGEDKGFKLGEGNTLVIGPEAHPKFFRWVRDLAETLEIPLHPEPAERASGTDGTALQVTREGVPTVVVSIPLRNMHTPVEMVSLKDVERAGRLLAEVATSLDDKTLASLALDE